jgi:hypothetical protein
MTVGSPPVSRSSVLLFPLLAGGVVAVALGVYGRLHTPSGIAVNVAGFSSPQTVKVWLASGAALLAVVQLLTARSSRPGPRRCTGGRGGERSC